MATYTIVVSSNAGRDGLEGEHSPDASPNDNVEDTEATMPIMEKANATVSSSCQAHH